MRRIVAVVFTVLLAMGMVIPAATAQDATPESATPVVDRAVKLLFVQTGMSSTIQPLEEAGTGGATHELTLREGPDQTIFFANRPDRVVGTVPSADAIDVLTADHPDGPPNAALVGHREDGTEEIIVLELMSGYFDPETHEVHYEVVLLADYEELNFDLEQTPVPDVDETREFGVTTLFIDDVNDDDLPIGIF